MIQKEDLTWEYHGRYGDDNPPAIVHVTQIPSVISLSEKKALLTIYKNNDGNYIEHCSQLESYGLIRPIGNAWNTQFIFAPIVHKWVKSENKNSKIVEKLKAQYKT